jgi:NADP-dependent 3-hydroxy acid dehydrogenase YdfG
MDSLLGMQDIMKTDDLRLDGKVAVVTGAASGIGQEIARARAGAKLPAPARSSPVLTRSHGWSMH